ncbi:hypothetical protein PTKIN_Ptkin04bG0041800 [Pterospermum kingtungense]
MRPESMEQNNTLFLFIILVVSLLVWLKLVKRKKLNLPPSPPKLPIIGNFHQLGKLPHRSLTDLSRKYGSLMLLQLGHNQTLVVSSAEMAREMVKNHDIVFSDKEATTAANILLYGCSGIGFAPYGEHWRQVRKLCVLELLSARRVHSFQFVREEEVELVINKIRHASVKGELVNLTEMMLGFSNNVVSRCAVSQKVEEEDGSSKFGLLLRRLLILLVSFSIGDMFPYLRWLDVLSGLIPSLKATSSEVDTFFDHIIDEHRSALKTHDESTDKKDFVSIILQIQKEGMLDMNLNKDSIKAIVQDMFLGGTDTTATLIDWMMAELLRHPNIMKKVQEEVRNVVGYKSKIDVDDINKMEYLKCVIKETLRFHTILPLFPRKVSAGVKLGGYDIPPNTTVFVNAWAIHRDPNWWEQPEEFIPERFENNTVDFRGQDFHFLPFGSGRRSCPGLHFGVASLEYMVANLLYWFDWKLPAGKNAESIDMTELYGFTVGRKSPLLVLPVSHFSV